MPNSNSAVMFATASGFRVLVWYEMSSNGFWVKDIAADEWYFNAGDDHWNFKRLVEGEASHQLRRGEDVADKNLLRRLREAKGQYFDTQIGA
jgi:hypothetical protein